MSVFQTQRALRHVKTTSASAGMFQISEKNSVLVKLGNVNDKWYSEA